MNDNCYKCWKYEQCLKRMSKTNGTYCKKNRCKAKKSVVLNQLSYHVFGHPYYKIWSNLVRERWFGEEKD